MHGDTTLFCQSLYGYVDMDISVSVTLLNEKGKTHILLPLRIISPFPLRKFPICLCAGLW